MSLNYFLIRSNRSQNPVMSKLNTKQLKAIPVHKARQNYINNFIWITNRLLNGTLDDRSHMCARFQNWRWFMAGVAKFVDHYPVIFKRKTIVDVINYVYAVRLAAPWICFFVCVYRMNS